LFCARLRHTVVIRESGLTIIELELELELGPVTSQICTILGNVSKKIKKNEFSVTLYSVVVVYSMQTVCLHNKIRARRSSRLTTKCQFQKYILHPLYRGQ